MKQAAFFFIEGLMQGISTIPSERDKGRKEMTMAEAIYLSSKNKYTERIRMNPNCISVRPVIVIRKNRGVRITKSGASQALAIPIFRAIRNAR